MEATLVVAGIVFIAAAIAGRGAVAIKIEFPSSTPLLRTSFESF